MPISNEISLYFHIPFCSRKCPYCHFYVVKDERAAREKLLRALFLEWEQQRDKVLDKQIISIYFGGGTPTLMGGEGIATILSWIPLLSPSCEITLEATPESLSPSLLHTWSTCGVNRISLGVQSFDDSILKILGRSHTSSLAQESILMAKEGGIDNISIDLMYDIPQQSLKSWRDTLSLLSSLPLTHLSLYNLTFEPDTPFFRRKKSLLPLLPSPEESLEMVEMVDELLEKMGFERYEISAFARRGYHSRHNTGYWIGRPFLGLGPSAFSYWEHRRFRNICDLEKYAQRLEEGISPMDFQEELSPDARARELLALRLRLCEGVEGTFPLANHSQILEDLEKRGWLEWSESRLKLTRQGRLFYDSVAEMII